MKYRNALFMRRWTLMVFNEPKKQKKKKKKKDKKKKIYLCNVVLDTRIRDEERRSWR